MRTRPLLLSLALAGALFAAGSEAAEPPSEVETLQKEVRFLRADIQALRRALSEIAELDRQRAQAIQRALEAAPRVEAPAASKAAETPSRSAAAPAAPGLGAAPPRGREEQPRAPRLGATASLTRASKSDGAKGGGTIAGKVKVNRGEPVAYVYVENVTGLAVRDEEVVIEQSGKQFVPSWAVIQRGTKAKFPNKDNIYHNVFSRSPGNSFDLGLYNSSDEGKEHTFTNAGPVDVYCNIHPRMWASILVVPNRYFAKVAADGSYVLRDVPPGKRKVVAWAPTSQIASGWVDLEGGGVASLDFELEARSGAHKNKDNKPYGSYP